MSRLYDTNPTAIEVRALVNDPEGNPIFDWLTLNVDCIEVVTSARTKTGGGASIRLKNGVTLLVSNSYSDVSEALVGDAKRFPALQEVEDEMLSFSPEDEAEGAPPSDDWGIVDDDSEDLSLDDLDDLSEEGGSFDFLDDDTEAL